MKFNLFNVTNLTSFAASGGLWAASEATPDVLWKTVLNAGGFGVMAMLLYRIHMTAIQQHATTLGLALQTFREEIGAERKDCNTRIDAIRADNSKAQEELRKTIKEAFFEAIRMAPPKGNQ